MALTLGVDAGASKTHALVVDETGKALGFGAAGCGNHQAAGLAAAVGQIRLAVGQALAGAGVPWNEARARIAHGCFCLAGADLAEDFAVLREAMAGLGAAARVTVKNDTMAALHAGLTRPYGVVVVCGTGFNAAGRGKDGRELVLPGLGAISGDWGGGAQLSKEVIRLVMRARDGRGARTALTERALAQLGAESEEALMRRLYFREVGEAALLGLVPLLFEVAEEGDEPARALLGRMGQEVGVTANALLRRLGLQEEAVEVVLAGGVFRGRGSLLIDTVRAEVGRAAPRAEVKRLEREPVWGAVEIGRMEIGD